jgi:hypothetical protein
VSGAVNTLDPIEAARADIAGSKHLIAAVADDLNRHQEWLENYLVSEKRHARWLQFQELKYRIERKRQALVRALQRFALSVALLVRSIWLFCVRLVTAFVAWLTPRAHALAVTLARWISAALTWTWATAVLLGRTFLGAALATFAWIALTSRRVALALAKAVSNTGNWIGAQLAALGHALKRWLYRAWLQTLFFARASAKTATIALGWTVTQSGALAHALRRLVYRSWLQARIFARASSQAASVAFVWIAAQSALLAHKLQRLLYWTWLEWRVFARASLKAASVASARAAAQAASLAHKLGRLLNRTWLEWRIFARRALEAASAGSSRAAKGSRIFAHAGRKSAVAGSSWAWQQAVALAQASLDGLAFVGARGQRLFDRRPVSTQPTWAWARLSGPARASLDGLAFVGAKSQRLFDRRVVSPTETMQRAEASIITQCTALICIEPWRARLPAIRGPTGAKPGFTWQLPPPPEARPPA